MKCVWGNEKDVPFVKLNGLVAKNDRVRILVTQYDFKNIVFVGVEICGKVIKPDTIPVTRKEINGFIKTVKLSCIIVPCGLRIK